MGKGNKIAMLIVVMAAAAATMSIVAHSMYSLSPFPHHYKRRNSAILLVDGNENEAHFST